jgi:hypothetical protein
MDWSTEFLQALKSTGVWPARSKLALPLHRALTGKNRHPENLKMPVVPLSRNRKYSQTIKGIKIKWKPTELKSIQALVRTFLISKIQRSPVNQ